MQNNRFFFTQLTKMGLQLLLYVSLFAIFFSILSMNNYQMMNLSRTAAITMATFAVLMLILTFVYGGFEIEHKKFRTVFSSILITTLFTDVITYFQLQVMNVNAANNPRLILFGEDFVLLLVAVFFQVCVIYILVSIGYRVYYKINPPQSCCIITSSQEIADHVAKKIANRRLKFKLCDVVHYECPDVKDTIRAYDTIFLAGIPDTEEGALQLFCYKRHKAIYLLSELEDIIISTSQQYTLDDTPFLYIHRMEPSLFQLFIKRLIDIVVSLTCLILFSPIMLIAALCIYTSERKSVFFRQDRATRHGKVFQIIKFRTMYERPADKPEECSEQENDLRVTPLGRILRKYRIDELPQFFNVLRGDMSIVGPRPEMLENVERYESEVPEFKYRRQMKAGLTGLAQIDGKYNTTPKDKAILDLLYIENFSLISDLKLIMRTLTIFFRKDSTEAFAKKSRQIAYPKMRTLPIYPFADTAHSSADKENLPSDEKISAAF